MTDDDVYPRSTQERSHAANNQDGQSDQIDETGS